MMNSSAGGVSNNETEHRFEITVDGHTGLLEYRLGKGSIAFTHTEVAEELAGKGVGSALAKAALTYAQQHQLSVIPFCSFVAGYIRRHPEYEALVSPEHRKLIQHAME